MARLTESLSIATSLHGNYNYSIREDYTEVFSKRQIVDNSNGFITLVSSNSSIAADSLSGAKAAVIKNNGVVAVEVQLILTDYKNNSNVDDGNAVDISGAGNITDRFITIILAAGEFLYLPSLKIISYAEDASAANAKPTTNGDYLTLDANEYVDTIIDIDNTTATNNVVGSASNTLVYLEQYTSAVNCAANYFHIGDLIRLTNEVLEVTAIGDKSDLANNTLTVKRGVHGTTAASDHSDDDAVLLPFFNAHHDFNKYSVVQTDINGKFKSMNFFGFGRVTDSTSDGIVPGSIAGKFYQRGYQSFGLSGITSATKSGLAASTAYGFTVNVDGAGAFVVSFTTDANNTNWGGNNGVLSKIQSVLDAAYSVKAVGATGYLFEKKVTASIIDGDIRFTSGQALSGSSIALGDHDATDPWGVGRWPALVDINTAVPAKVPVDSVVRKDGLERPRTGIFFYDDGHGNIRGNASGTINYTTGAFDIVGPPDAEFVITANYDSAHGGGPNTTATSANVVRSISARSCNSKINCPIEIVAFN